MGSTRLACTGRPRRVAGDPVVMPRASVMGDHVASGVALADGGAGVGAVFAQHFAKGVARVLGGHAFGVW